MWATPGDPTGQKAKYQAKVENDARADQLHAAGPDPGTGPGGRHRARRPGHRRPELPVRRHHADHLQLRRRDDPRQRGNDLSRSRKASSRPSPVGARRSSRRRSRSSSARRSPAGAPLQVTFSNDSTGAPTSQVWNFNDVGAGGTGVGTVSSVELVHARDRRRSRTDAPARRGKRARSACHWTCRMPAAADSKTTPADYITVTVPPAPPAPIAEFTATPRSGSRAADR